MNTGKIFAVVMMMACAALAGEKNLVRNGNLEEEERGTAAGWSAIDGLVTKWIRRADGRGHCLQMNTAVLQSEKKAWLENPETYKPHEGKRALYGTVGAHEGAWAWAWPIDLPKGWRYYVLSVDVRCLGNEAKPNVLVRGYRRITGQTAGRNSSWFHVHHPGGPAYSEQFGNDSQRRNSRAGDYLMVYRHTLHCDLKSPGKWQHFELGIQLPSMQSAIPERILLKPYAYWPNDVYEFDNLIFRKATKEEVMRLRSRKPRKKS